MSSPMGIPQEFMDMVRDLSPAQKEDIIRAFTPRVVSPYFRQIPHPVQQAALSSNAREILYGGAAGGGKSSYMLMSALQYVDVPGYSALILRRTWPDLNAPEAILDRMKKWMAGLPVKMREQGRSWEFPSGAVIQFGYIQRDDAKYKFQGAEYQFIGYDELTQFEESVYTWLFSRLRKPQINCMSCSTALTRVSRRGVDPYFVHAENGISCPRPLPDPMVMERYQPAPDGTTVFDVPLRVRSCSNPGGKGHQWVKDYFIEPSDGTKPKGKFIPASIRDNPSLNAKEYEETLDYLSVVDRARMLNGDWDVLDAGAMFARGDFETIGRPLTPDEVKARVRSWDLAATTSKSSDWTVGAKVAILKDNRWVIEDVVRFQAGPSQVEAKIREVAELDGLACRIVMEQEPGSAGVNNTSHYARNILSGFRFKGIRSTGDKELRAQAFASQVEHGNVYLRLAGWNTNFLNEAQLFPSGAHDDQIDAVSLGFSQISAKRKVRIIV